MPHYDYSAKLEEAVINGHLRDVIVSLAAGTDPNQTNKEGKTLLHLAALNGHERVVKELIDAGAEIDLLLNTGETPLFLAAELGHQSVVKELVDAGAEINLAMANTGATPLFIAARYGHQSVVQDLVVAGAEINLAINTGATSLFIAARYGHQSVVKALVDADAIINPTLTTGETPLFIAAFFGYLPVVKALLSVGADINQPTNDGTTPLYIAALFGHFEIVQALQRHQHANLAHSPIPIASQQEYPEFVKAFLQEETVRDFYLNKIIQTPERMNRILMENSVFFNELATHRNALWARLSGPEHFNLNPDAHKTLLEAILNTHKVHPLRNLFSEPQSLTVNITLDDIQEYTDATYPEPTFRPH